MATDDRALLLRKLHVPGTPLVLANIYDPSTAEFVASNPSSSALATASYAIAKVHGLEDDALDLDTNLAAARRIIPVAIRHNKPITIDLQDGYGDQLEEAVEAIVEAGASGCNLEDHDNETGQLFPFDVALDRVRRVLAAASKAGVPNFALNARTDAILLNNDVDEAIRRGKAFLDAGATTVISKDLGGRINVIAWPNGLSVQELADIGVARISVGPRLWRSANAGFEKAATDLLTEYEAMKETRK
ncbi:PEP phosphonomutase [Histoplasma capsulatum H143]|uniref:PEP phosphonomutase n=1 Tax=Ajellomyces capsulatus (strain H143) TaxID=544712 RepID=C6H248_AJECH|nr:PEP phosphonomutase [Histoplasma capsulatum H143]